jgi:hypothetical protein
MKDFGIWSFASRSGFVIRCPRERLFRLFLGSSAVEHSTVNRMVAGSNPARGASTDSLEPMFPWVTLKMACNAKACRSFWNYDFISVSDHKAVAAA